MRAVLRSPALRRVMGAFLLFNASVFGTWVAVLVYAYDATGPGSVGLVALVQVLPVTGHEVALAAGHRTADDRLGEPAAGTGGGSDSRGRQADL